MQREFLEAEFLLPYSPCTCRLRESSPYKGASWQFGDRHCCARLGMGLHTYTSAWTFETSESWQLTQVFEFLFSSGCSCRYVTMTDISALKADQNHTVYLCPARKSPTLYTYSISSPTAILGSPGLHTPWVLHTPSLRTLPWYVSSYSYFIPSTVERSPWPAPCSTIWPESSVQLTISHSQAPHRGVCNIGDFREVCGSRKRMRQLIVLMQEVLFSGCGCIYVCPLWVYSLNIQVYIWFAYFLAYGALHLWSLCNAGLGGQKTATSWGIEV